MAKHCSPYNADLYHEQRKKNTKGLRPQQNKRRDHSRELGVTRASDFKPLQKKATPKSDPPYRNMVCHARKQSNSLPLSSKIKKVGTRCRSPSYERLMERCSSPFSRDSSNTSRRFALGASNVCLVLVKTRRAPSRHSVCVCVLHIKPFFYSSTSSTPSVRTDSSP